MMAFFTISSPTVALNQWQHLALVYDGSTLKFYKNGVLSGSVAASGSFSNSTQPLHIGRLPLNSTTSFYFGGKLDDPALWGKALTASEVLCLYKGDLAPTTTGLLLHYSFNTGVANGSNATLTTLPATVGTIPAVTSNMAMTGSSSNLVAAGVARQQGSRLSFRTWLSYGLPTVGLQLLVASLWCWHASQ